MQVLTLGMPLNLKDISKLAHLSYPPYSIIIKFSVVFSALNFIFIFTCSYLATPCNKNTYKEYTINAVPLYIIYMYNFAWSVVERQVI